MRTEGSVKALVTGGTGFVGSHVVRVLVEAGHTVRVLHRQTSRLDALAGLPYESAVGELTDREALLRACDGCDWVFHVAAVADYWRSDVVKMFEANVEGTRTVLKAARAAGVQRVILTSTAAAVGMRRDGRPASESDAFNLPPRHFPYGYSKWLAEEVARAEARKGLDVVITNPVVVMGPGDLNMISGNFVTQIKRLGPLVPVTSGGVAVIDVRDVARLQLAAAERGRTGERYILGTANYDYRTWFAMIADVVGVRRPFLPVPDAALPVVAGVIDMARRLGIPTPVDADQTRLSSRAIFFDFSKTWNELGEPQVPMRKSLEDTYRWYVENGYLKA
nr:MAG: nucleoside-diphosphate sugar epimerase [Chloroflexota bacterium]